jgi:hypothetical protein
MTISAPLTKQIEIEARREKLIDIAHNLPPCEKGYCPEDKLKHFKIRVSAESLFPIISQLKTYSLNIALLDIQAGFAIASILTPQAIALAALARVPPVNAIISSIYPLLIYAFLGSSKNLSIGPEGIVFY